MGKTYKVIKCSNCGKRRKLFHKKFFDMFFVTRRSEFSLKIECDSPICIKCVNGLVDIIQEKWFLER